MAFGKHARGRLQTESTLPVILQVQRGEAFASNSPLNTLQTSQIRLLGHT